MECLPRWKPFVARHLDVEPRAWSYGWSANPFYQSPAFSQWTSSPTNFSDTENPNTVSATSRLAQSRARTTFAGPPDSAALISELARLNGEPAPTGIRTVATTRAAAFAALGARADDVPQTPSDLVVAHGAFTGFLAKKPLGGPPPKGRVLFLLIDRASGTVTDWGIGDIDPRIPAER